MHNGNRSPENKKAPSLGTNSGSVAKIENRCACIINPDAGRPIFAPTSQYGERALTAIDIGWWHSAANDGRPISQMSCYASESNNMDRNSHNAVRLTVNGLGHQSPRCTSQAYSLGVLYRELRPSGQGKRVPRQDGI